jgi:hypothetical protein
MNSRLDDYVPFSGAQSIDLTGSGNFGSLSVSGVPVVTGSIDTSNFALLNHDHDTDYASITHSHILNDLDDVSITHAAMSDGQVLQWDSINSNFEAATLDFASTDHVHSEYLDDSDLAAYSVTASAAASGTTPLAPAGSGGQYHTAMTADNQFIAISYLVDAGYGDGTTIGKVDIFKRNSDGTLSDRFSLYLGDANAPLPIAIAKLSDSTYNDLITSTTAPPPGGDGGLILYNVLSYDGAAGQLAKAHCISLVGDEIDYTSSAADFGFITTSSFTEQAHSISITENGEKIALGCNGSDSGGSNSGRVFVYQMSIIPDLNFAEIRDYVGSNDGGRFGESLSYSAYGDLLAVKAGGSFGGTSGAVVVIDDSDANYSAVSANLAAGESPYEYKFSSAIFSVADSQFNDATSNSYHGNNNYNFIVINDLPASTSYFGTPVLKYDATTEAHLSIVTAKQGKVYSFTDQGTGSWTAKGAPFSSTVDGSNAYSIDSTQDGNTIVVSYNAWSSMSEFDFDQGHQIKRFVYNSTTNSWDSGTIVASIPDANTAHNKFRSVLIASDGSFITTAMSDAIAQSAAGSSDGLFRVYEYQNIYATREHNHALSALSDIDQNYISGGVAPYEDGAALIWNAASGKWRALSNFFVNKNLNDLSDVGGYTNASLTGGEVLQWDDETNQFEAKSTIYPESVETEDIRTRFLLFEGDGGSTHSFIQGYQSPQAPFAKTLKIVCEGGTVSIGDPSNTDGGDQVDLNVARNVTIGGNLTVNGTATTVNTTNLDVEDSIIKLNLNGGGNFETGGIGGSSGIEIEAGEVVANGGNDRKARFVYNSGDSSAASYGADLGFFEATYEEDNAGLPVLGHLKMKVKGLEVERTAIATATAAEVASGEVSDQPGFDNLGNFEDFMSGLNA